MKKYLLIISLTIISIALSAQGFNKRDLKKIKKFFVSFQKTALNNDTSKLKEFICPLKSESGEEYRNELIERVIENNESHMGDFSYSNNAIQQIIDSLYTKFKPVSKDLYPKLARQSEFIVLKDLTLDNIPVFDYKNAHIILIKTNNKIYLLFWEGLNKLLL